MKRKKIEDIQVGDSASFSKTITETDVYNFAGISGDFNPTHINESYAKEGIFKERVAHGMIGASLISTVLGTHLTGCIYLSQEVKFVKPVFFGDTITATCTIKEVIEEKNVLVLDTVCTNQKDESVITGSATILLPE